MKFAGVLGFVIACITSGVHCDGETVLRVLPANIAVQPGEDVELKCTRYPESENPDTDPPLEWYREGDETPIPSPPPTNKNQTETNGSDSNSGRITSDSGVLTISGATYNDSGKYICKEQNGTLEDFVSEVKVYDMPTYITEIIVVLAINGGLIIVFILCSVWTYVREKRETARYHKQQKLGHREKLIKHKSLKMDQDSF